MSDQDSNDDMRNDERRGQELSRRRFGALTLGAGLASVLGPIANAADTSNGKAGKARTTSIEGFQGDLITPSDPRYDEARGIFNKRYDTRPALIARCSSVDDVVAALRYGREHDLPIAVRSGGNNGFGTADGCIVIHLSGLNQVSVDPARRRVKVGGGTLVGAIDGATKEHGLMVPMGSFPRIGIGGLTLGGGAGVLSRQYGMTIDNLLSAQVVTADGKVLTANKSEHPDLFWALRGGGGNFGIATEFEFSLHKVPDVIALTMFHPQKDVVRVVTAQRDTVESNPPDELMWISLLRKPFPGMPVPPEVAGKPGVLTLILWSGDAATGQERLAAIQRQLAPPMGSIAPLPYFKIQSQNRDLTGGRMYQSTGFIGKGKMSDQAIALLADHGAEVASMGAQIEVVQQGGAQSRVPPEATAYPHRKQSFSIQPITLWMNPADDEREIAWSRNTAAALKPFMTGGHYINVMDPKDKSEVEPAFGSALARLRKVKRAYDPDNTFHLNQNIRPA